RRRALAKAGRPVGLKAIGPVPAASPATTTPRLPPAPGLQTPAWWRGKVPASLWRRWRRRRRWPYPGLVPGRPAAAALPGPRAPMIMPGPRPAGLVSPPPAARALPPGTPATPGPTTPSGGGGGRRSGARAEAEQEDAEREEDEEQEQDGVDEGEDGAAEPRSEERRVGKEGRGGWEPSL